MGKGSEEKTNSHVELFLISSPPSGYFFLNEILFNSGKFQLHNVDICLTNNPVCNKSVLQITQMLI